MKNKIIFWDVDTQLDFMQPGKSLYIRGAETIIDRISEVRKFALENGFSIIASTDWHSPGDKEISQEPDNIESYPRHCIANTSGAQRLGFLGDIPIKHIATELNERSQLEKLVNVEPFHITIRKNKIDVFSNPNTELLLDIISPEKIIIFGVALDICVSYTIEGLHNRTDAGIIVLADAVKGLGKKPDHEILEGFKGRGVDISTLADLKELLDVAI